MAFALVVALFVAGVVGYVIGHQNRGPTFRVASGIVYATPTGGTAYLGPHQPLNRAPKGFAYFFPPSLASITPTGAITDGQRPQCVPYYHAVRIKKMEAVLYPIAGGYQGTILWVQC